MIRIFSAAMSSFAVWSKSMLLLIVSEEGSDMVRMAREIFEADESPRLSNRRRFKITICVEVSSAREDFNECTYSKRSATDVDASDMSVG